MEKAPGLGLGLGVGVGLGLRVGLWLGLGLGLGLALALALGLALGLGLGPRLGLGLPMPPKMEPRAAEPPVLLAPVRLELRGSAPLLVRAALSRRERRATAADSRR